MDAVSRVTIPKTLGVKRVVQATPVPIFGAASTVSVRSRHKTKQDLLSCSASFHCWVQSGCTHALTLGNFGDAMNVVARRLAQRVTVLSFCLSPCDIKHVLLDT